MKIALQRITINSPVDKVWKVLSDDFVAVSIWMAAIKISEEITKGTKVSGAPVIGRKSIIWAVEEGRSFLEETITAYDEKNKSLTVKSVLKNNSNFSPMISYTSIITVKKIDENTSEVIWDGSAELQLLGYPMYFLVKKWLAAWFYRGIEELQHFMDTGKPHPRKIAFLKKWGMSVK